MEEIRLPQLGQSVEEAYITQWFKKEGDHVTQGDLLFSIQTDKAEIDCESSATGILRKILLDTDVTVPVMTVVALVGEPDEPLPDLSRHTQPDAALPRSAASPETTYPTGPAFPTEAVVSERFISPRARTKAEELGVDTADIPGTGVGGRVTEADVVGYAEEVKARRVTPTARRLAQLRGVDLRTVQGSGPRGKIAKADVERVAPSKTVEEPIPAPAQRIPLTPMRRTIAKRMTESFFSAPHYYVTFEVDMSAAIAFRERDEAFRPSFNDLVMWAVARAIRQCPEVNRRWVGDALEQMADINLGFAVALPDGLVAPVVKHVQQKTLQQVSGESQTLLRKAREGKLLPDEYRDNTFTISNMGSLGVDQFTAIINPPDSAILAVGQVTDRPVVIDKTIHIRPIVKLTLSSDHRVIDGAVAARFMGLVKRILERAEF